MIRALLPGALVLLLLAGLADAGPLSGPVLDDGVAAELVDILQFPASAGSAPLARIEFLREAPDGSGRLFANDMRGPLHLIEGTTVSSYLDMRTLAPKLKTNDLQLGFVSFAFHPDFATNGLLYTAHTESLGVAIPNLEPALPIVATHHAVVTEWTATDPAANVFSGSSRELMRIASPHPYHNLGEIAFDPGLSPEDPEYGLLYVAAGDFGSVFRGDFDQLQRLDTVYGCILRIDPLGGPFLRDSISYPYGIPATNPYAGDGDPDTLGEIYAHGFRNPQNFHFDRGGVGSLYVAEIGESNLEEVNILGPGKNYGWPLREGTYALDVATSRWSVFPVPAGDDSLGFSYPAAQFDHWEGFAIAGGLAARQGPASELLGHFLFGDIVTGKLFYSNVDSMLALDDAMATTADIYQLHVLRDSVETTVLDVLRAELNNPSIGRSDIRFSSDLSGRLYLTTKQDGYLRELVPVPSGPTQAAPARAGDFAVEIIPNPFNPRTEIRFTLRREARVRLVIYDLRGRKVRLLLDDWRPGGVHRISWNGRDDLNQAVGSAVYWYRLTAGGRSSVGKLSLIR